jgi:hypothetical protein
MIPKRRQMLLVVVVVLITGHDYARGSRPRKPEMWIRSDVLQKVLQDGCCDNKPTRRIKEMKK